MFINFLDASAWCFNLLNINRYLNVWVCNIYRYDVKPWIVRDFPSYCLWSPQSASWGLCNLQYASTPAGVVQIQVCEFSSCGSIPAIVFSSFHQGCASI